MLKENIKIKYTLKRYGYLENLVFEFKNRSIKIEEYLKKGWRIKLSGGYYTDFRNKVINVFLDLPRKNNSLHVISVFHEIAHHKIHSKKDRHDRYKLLIYELEAWIKTLELLGNYRNILPSINVIYNHILDSIKSQMKK